MRWAFLGLLVLALLLAPFFVWGEALSGWTARMLDSSHSPALKAGLISALLALDVVAPVPSSLVATASGALLGFAAGAAATFAGMTAGCLLAYGLGSRGLRRLAPSDFDRVAGAAARYGAWSLILFRAVPVLAEASVLFAGLSRMSFWRFLLLTSASNLGISVAYAAVGAFSVHASSFLLAFAGSILTPLGALLLARRRL